MKLIMAAAEPFELEEERAALDKLGVRGITTSEAN
jgi:nitrogen regulatory protein PII